MRVPASSLSPPCMTTGFLGGLPVGSKKRKKTEDGLYQAVFGRASVKLRPKLSSVHGPPKLGTEGCTEAVPYVKWIAPVVKRGTFKVLREERRGMHLDTHPGTFSKAKFFSLGV